jgi:hypothetical protein
MKNFKNIVLMLFLMTGSSIQNEITAQATSSFGGSPAPFPNRPFAAVVNYLGWDNTVNVPLVIQHLNQQPIQFWLNDLNLGSTVINRAEWTVGQAMLENNGAVARTDGLRIWNPGYANSVANGAEQALDLWTGVGNSTHIRFDGSGLIQTTNNHFEIFGRLNGFWFNAAPLLWQQANFRSNYVFNIDSIEVGRYCNPNNAQRGFMRWGLQPNPAAPVDAARRMEIFDRDNLPQFRITQNANTAFTDFQTKASGNFIINTVNSSVQYTGIGDFNALNVEPVRRLEVLDMNERQPQLRLTRTPDANINNGIWTDFQTTNNGDLYIHPSAANRNRFVGINTAAPLNTLEINSTAGVSPRPSGLRFTNLNAASANDISPNGRVLTVDNNGHVVLTNDVGGGSVNSTCATQDIVARFDNTGNVIQCSDIFNNAASVNNRIGFFTTSP